MVVSGVRVGPLSAGGAVTGIPAHTQVSIAGTYGTLLVSDNGDYTYQLDDNAATTR